jgi:hypothetical protein
MTWCGTAAEVVSPFSNNFDSSLTPFLAASFRIFLAVLGLSVAEWWAVVLELPALLLLRYSLAELGVSLRGFSLVPGSPLGGLRDFVPVMERSLDSLTGCDVLLAPGPSFRGFLAVL